MESSVSFKRQSQDEYIGLVGDKLKIEIVKNDITNEKVDAITNAANEHLAHGGGVAGAIVRKGGRVIQNESNEYVKKHGIVETGNCGVTGGGSLKCKYVIHAVGPIWNHSKTKKYNVDLLYNAVFNTLKTAEELKCASVAIPAISSGIFGFPKPLCAETFFTAIRDFTAQQQPQELNHVRLTNFDDETTDIFKEEFEKWFAVSEEEVAALTLYFDKVEQSFLPQLVSQDKLNLAQVTDKDQVKELKPHGSFPLLKSGEGEYLSGYLAIITFLCPAESSLFGKSAFQKAEVDQFLSFAITGIQIENDKLGRIVFEGAEDKDQTLDKIKQQLLQIESKLHSTGYLVGDSLTLADLATFTALQTAMTVAIDQKFQQEQIPSLATWFEKLAASDDVKRVIGLVKLCKHALI